MNTHLLIRKSHRYLGLSIGIQFLLWTISGLYFSWNDLDNVHGDHLRKAPHGLNAGLQLASPNESIQQLQKDHPVDSIHSVALISLAGTPLYQIAYFAGGHGHDHHVHPRYALADAITGEIRQPLNESEAVRLAQDYVVGAPELKSVNYLENTGGGHEYRERPLPAWAVSFNKPECTVYISAERGTFQSIRHDQWRAFDFLWMFHTMDYDTRDDFNNWLLKTFSVLGLITVVSGFALFIVSSRMMRRGRK
jgi:uncharacterized iron-regulated membrane protein